MPHGGGTPSAPLAVRTTVDLRRYLEDRRSEVLSNLSAVIALAVPVDPNAPFERWLCAVRDAMNAHKRGFLGLASLSSVTAQIEGLPFWLYRRLLGARLLAPSSGGKALILTNMGVLDPATLRFDTLEPTQVFLTPSVPVPPLIFVGVSTFCDRLTLSTGFYDGQVDPRAIDRLIGGLDEALPH